MYKIKEFKNGLKLITVPIEGIETVTTMVVFGVGSRNENRKNNGISHFLEHMIFKGTKKWPDPRKVAEKIDRVGGSYNAFTGKEYTGYYAKVAWNDLSVGLNWLSENIVNASMDEKLLEKERGVIVEEMNMYEDTPAQNIHDVFEEVVFGDQPAGWRIIGSKKTILDMKKEELMKYKKNFYTKDNCIVVVCGKLQKDVNQKVGKYFSKLQSKSKKNTPKTDETQESPQIKILKKKTDQSHCMLGFRTFDLFDERRYVMSVIANILGGGMSSRLFDEIRVKRGMAYYVGCDTEYYKDSGYIVSQAGLENSNISKAIGLILKEFTKLKQKKIPKDELTKVKNFINGQNLIALETSNSRAFFFASQYLLTGKVETLKERLKKIEAVTSSDIQDTAREFFTKERLNFALIGPDKKKKDISGIIKKYK